MNKDITNISHAIYHLNKALGYITEERKLNDTCIDIIEVIERLEREQ